MKKNNYFLHIILTIVLFFAGTKSYAVPIAVPNDDGVIIYYNYINNYQELEVTCQSNTYDKSYSGYVVIPSEVTHLGQTFAVTRIGNNAFYECGGVTSVVLPNTIKSIGRSAFKHCGLKTINIPASVTTIDYEAFSMCQNINKVIVEDLSAWCNISFAYCANPLRLAHHLYSDPITEITDLVLPTDITSIGSYAFQGCACTSVTFPPNITSIGDQAFASCTSLKKIIVSDIGAWCNISFGDNPLFYAHYLYSDQDTRILDLVIPNTVTTIENSAFNYCYISTLKIPSSVTKIGNNAFYNGIRLNKLTIGDIASWCGIDFGGGGSNPIPFSEHIYVNNTEITEELVIPNTVTTIKPRAFTGFTSLNTLTLPSSLVSIGSNSFEGCTGLNSVTLPNSLESIGNYSFKGCRGLTTLTIPNSVSSIGDYSFDECNNLSDVISKMEQPCSLPANAFSEESYFKATLYVPEGKKQLYNEINYWKRFSKIEEFVVNDITLSNNIQTIVDAEDGTISVSGLADGQQVAIYQTDGKQVATAKAYNGSANVATNISKGTPVIVKIGEKAVKVVMQ